MFASYKFQRSPPPPLRFCFCSKVLPHHLLYFRFSILPSVSRALEFVLPLHFLYRLHDKARSIFFFFLLRIFLVSLFSPSQLHFFYTQTIFGSLFLLRIPAKSFEVTERKMVFRKNIEQPRSEETRDVRLDGGVVLYFEV